MPQAVKVSEASRRGLLGTLAALSVVFAAAIVPTTGAFALGWMTGWTGLPLLLLILGSVLALPPSRLWR
jgi:hypothetical protein